MAINTSRNRRPGRPRNPISREELLGVATRAFARTGYAGTSTSTIARAAGLSKASLFHHYPSKEELYLAVLGKTIGDLSEPVLKARLSEGSYEERLDRLSHAVVDYFSAHHDAARLLLRELVDNGPFVAGEGSAIVLAILNDISSFMAAGMEDGAFGRQSPEQLALSIVGVHLYYFSSAEVVGRYVGAEVFSKAQLEERRGAVVEHIRRLCLKA